MVKEIKIQNYKSVQDLSLELGRINVLIGANGCGKSNILEAIAFGSAASEDKLGNEFLSSRGIRVTEPKTMRSGFDKESSLNPIVFDFKIGIENIIIDVHNGNTAFSEWSKNIKSQILEKRNIVLEDLSHTIKATRKMIAKVDSVNELSSELKDEILTRLSTIGKISEESNMRLVEYEKNVENFTNFLIYAPENTFLRKFEDESQVEPLGIRGEGLFKLLSVMSQETPEEFQEIIENLELIDWFEGFEIPKDLVFTERRIRIKDRFLEEGLQYFDQRSSNEGFLFLMFYFALFISKYTPKFFAIDNIDASLNPKLCIELIKILTKLAKKHDKQVIFTTHNPAILDGLNLNDDEVRLLVVSRNKDGHTKTKRITPTPVPEGEIPVRLSEKFMRGYIGGLPKNF
jgi:predicted ATPase